MRVIRFKPEFFFSEITLWCMNTTMPTLLRLISMMCCRLTILTVECGSRAFPLQRRTKSGKEKS